MVRTIFRQNDKINFIFHGMWGLPWSSLCLPLTTLSVVRLTSCPVLQSEHENYSSWKHHTAVLTLFTKYGGSLFSIQHIVINNLCSKHCGYPSQQ